MVLRLVKAKIELNCSQFRGGDFVRRSGFIPNSAQDTSLPRPRGDQTKTGAREVTLDGKLFEGLPLQEDIKALVVGIQAQ